MTRRGRAFGVLLVGSLVLVGCGGGDKKEATGTPVTTAAPTGGGSTGGSAGGSTGGDGITSAKCIAAATAMSQAAGSLGAFTGSDDANLEDSVQAFQAFAAAAPSEIRDDLKKVADGYTAFMKVLDDANFDPSNPASMTPEALAKLEAASTSLDNSDFQAAADRVEAWFTNECGE